MQTTLSLSVDEPKTTTTKKREMIANSSFHRRPMLCHLTLTVGFVFLSALLPWEANSARDLSPMVFPLVLSRSNNSFHRRELSAAGSARMRLYGDLVTDGYYSTKVYIGTPPQGFTLFVDTGSAVTFVPCSNCQHCGQHQNPRFEPTKSTTYEPQRCTKPCACNPEGTQCTFSNRYAESSTVKGVLGDDVIGFGDQGGLTPQRLVFGCGTYETGDVFTQNADGMLGLRRGEVGIVDQLVGNGVIGDSFSLCYGGMDVGGGFMVLGEFPVPAGMTFSPSDPLRSPYYNIDLKNILVSGVPLLLDSSVFDGDSGTFIDSGTTLAYLPQQAFIAFKVAIMKELRNPVQIPGASTVFQETCFSGYGSDVSQLSNSFPEVDMVFNNGQKFSLSSENYLYRHLRVEGAYCLGVLPNESDKSTILGGIIFRNTLVTYDRKNQRIGFWKTNCGSYG